jgi:hypothetical protein
MMGRRSKTGSGVSEEGEPCKTPDCDGHYERWDCGCSFGCEACPYAFQCDKCGNLQRYLRKRICMPVYGNNRAMKRHFIKCIRLD